MYPCNYPGCGETFPNHTALAEHIFRDHAARMFAAVLVALVIALALLVSPAKADSTQPPSRLCPARRRCLAPALSVAHAGYAGHGFNEGIGENDRTRIFRVLEIDVGG